MFSLSLVSTASFFVRVVAEKKSNIQKKKRELVREQQGWTLYHGLGSQIISNNRTHKMDAESLIAALLLFFVGNCPLATALGHTPYSSSPSGMTTEEVRQKTPNLSDSCWLG